MKTNTNPTSTTTHTPGPWVVDYSGPARIAITDTLGNEVALCSMQCHDGDTDESNASLIAAAPDLLALAKDGAEMFDKLTGENLAIYARTYSAIARAAITKARGQL